MKNASTSLFWKYRKNKISSILKGLQIDNCTADVTLVSDDKVNLQAHKIVLSASSPVLKNLLLMNPHPHPVIYMRNIKHKELLSLLQFMYLGETNVSQHHIQAFIKTAKDLEMDGLDVEENLQNELFENNSNLIEHNVKDSKIVNIPDIYEITKTFNPKNRYIQKKAKTI